MSNYARYRDWHLWIGLILLVPLSVIATTGFLWNHEKSLGIKHDIKMLQANRLPVSSHAATARLSASPDSWTTHASAIDAALAEARRAWGDDVELERIELRNEPGMGIVVKVKAPEEADIRPYEIVWSAADGRVVEKKGDPQAGTDWAKIVHDLHTGRFFSKQYGFIWSDASALAILALGITGSILYAIPLMKKRAKRKKTVGAIAETPRGTHSAPQLVAAVRTDAEAS